MMVPMCDRCKASALDPTVLAKPRSLVIPQKSPATSAVTEDHGTTLSIDSTQDFCGICLASALLEYALSIIGAAALTPDMLNGLSDRIGVAVKGVK